MARQSKTEREREERRARARALSLTLFELSGKMTQAIRDAEGVGFLPIAQQVMFMQKKIDKWRSQIAEKQATWGS